MTTTFGEDVSHHQPGLEVESLPGEFLIARTSFGMSTADREYRRFRDESKAAQKLFAAYHYLTEAPVVEQVKLAASVAQETPVPFMLDLEPSDKVKGVYQSKPTLQTAFKARLEFARLGYRVSMLYLPKWYWEMLGRPDLTGWRLVQSRYTAGYEKGSVSGLYAKAGGDQGDGWDSYGGVEPTIWQYTSSAVIPRYTQNTVDADAFRGTREDLAKTGLFLDFKAKPKPRPNRVGNAIAELEKATPVGENKAKVAEALRLLKLTQ